MVYCYQTSAPQNPTVTYFYVNHRIIVSSNPLCHGQGHLPLDQVAQGPVKPDFEHFQGRGINNFFSYVVWGACFFSTQFSCLLIHFNFLKLFAVSQLLYWTAHTRADLDIPGVVVAMPNTAESSHQLGSCLDTVLELSSLDFHLLRCSQISWCCNMTCYYHHQQLSSVSWA